MKNLNKGKKLAEIERDYNKLKQEQEEKMSKTDNKEKKNKRNSNNIKSKKKKKLTFIDTSNNLTNERDSNLLDETPNKTDKSFDEGISENPIIKNNTLYTIQNNGGKSSTNIIYTKKTKKD